MLKSIFRLSVMVITGAFLKPRIKGLLILLGFWLLLWFLQSEYLSYVDYTGDANFVLYVSLIKVGLILFSLLVYGLVIERRIFRNKNLPTASVDAGKNLNPLNAQDDGFDFIRQKKKLRGKSDQLLDK
jgi:hypothetical protein